MGKHEKVDVENDVLETLCFIMLNQCFFGLFSLRRRSPAFAGAADFTRVSVRKKARIPCDRVKKRDVENDFSKRFTCVPGQAIFSLLFQKSGGFLL